SKATSMVKPIPSRIIGKYPCKSNIHELREGKKGMPRDPRIPWQNKKNSKLLEASSEYFD
ncbi:MAG: hypothetical protein QF649_05170, partial [SAR324 cluster bacterium]|nr:hypothetical protein [SAR324 cluster bacterium]